jgi:hypothetical protein
MNMLTNLGRFALVAGLGALSLTACGGSDGGGSADGFCDSLVRLDGSDVNPDADFDGAIAALEDLKSNASGDLQDDIDTFISVMNKINDAGEDAAFEEFEDDFEKMTAAIESIEEFATANCEGLPDDLFN